MPLSTHTFDPDSSGLSCKGCPMQQRHPIHDTIRPAVNTPAVSITINQTATSQAAGDRFQHRSGTLRKAAYELIANRPGGATCEEIEQELHRSHQSVSSAVNSLVQQGHIRPLIGDDNAARVRKTRSGREAAVYIAAAQAGAA